MHTSEISKGENDKHLILTEKKTINFFGKSDWIEKIKSELNTYGSTGIKVNVASDDIHHLNFENQCNMLFGFSLDQVQKLNIANHTNFKIVLQNKITELPLSTQWHIMGFQRHLSSIQDVQKLESYSHNSASLGLIKSIPSLIEPYLRETEILHIDLDVLAKHVTHSQNSIPTGMDVDTLIQIGRFVSQSPNIKVISFESKSLNQELVQIVSMFLWYFMEGFAQGSFYVDDAHEKEIIHLSETDEPLIFYHHTYANRWWVGISDNKSEAIPCTADEYEQATLGNLSDRIIARLHL